MNVTKRKKAGLSEERRYFETEKAAEDFLISDNFDFGGDRGGRYAWTSRSGLVDADVRFNSLGFFIAYRA